MKRNFLILMVVGLFFTISGYAQPPGGGPGGQFDPAEMVKRQTQEMVDSLGLNKDQATKVQALNEKYSAKMQEMFKNGKSEDRDAMHEKMQAMQTEQKEELKKILTPEQFEKYKEMEENRMKRHHDRMDGGGEAPDRRGRTRGSGD